MNGFAAREHLVQAFEHQTDPAQPTQQLYLLNGANKDSYAALVDRILPLVSRYRLILRRGTTNLGTGRRLLNLVLLLCRYVVMISCLQTSCI